MCWDNNVLQQAIDLREEGDELFQLLDGLSEADWERQTPFKQWTINKVVDHLHFSDRAAVLSLQDPDAFLAMANGLSRNAAIAPGADAPRPAKPVGRELLSIWREYFLRMCDLLGATNPDARVKWFGPDMSARMFTTARQMETWAHGQDIYDLLGVERTNTDRLKNIAVIGVRTFGWTFVNRKLEPPGTMPYVRLAAPSGAIWEWGTPSETDCVSGSAVAFCHVVTQGRNILDTNLRVVGDVATRWMAIAQCFAGPPEDPPAPGTRV